MAMDAFIMGLARRDFKEALGRQKPTSVANLLKIATEWADGEDMARTTRGSSPRDNHDSGSRSRRDSYRDDRRRKRSKRHYDDDRPEFMAAGFSTPRNAKTEATDDQKIDGIVEMIAGTVEMIVGTVETATNAVTATRRKIVASHAPAHKTSDHSMTRWMLITDSTSTRGRRKIALQSLDEKLQRIRPTSI